MWQDEFDGAAGTAPDVRHWNHDTGGDGWGNQELQDYAPPGRNARLDGAGHLVITAEKIAPGKAAERGGNATCWYGPCTYRSARLTTLHKVTVQEGRVEARMKVPRGKGLWSAFWLMGDDFDTVGHPASGEIDVTEVLGHEPNVTWASVHGPGYVRAGLTKGYSPPNDAALSDDFHTYTVEWIKQGLTFSVDGHEYYSVARTDIGEGRRWVFDKPFFLILNVAVGGEWPGAPDDSVLPSTLVVDSVRVFGKAAPDDK